MDSSEIRSGARVVVDGLKARPELNGSSGTVGTLSEESGRWNVMIDDMREPLALKAASLSLDDKWAGIVVGTVVRLSGLEDKQEMYNGKLASVRSFAGELCSVYVEAERESIAVKRPCMVVAEEAPSANGKAVDIGDGDELPIQVSCNGVALKLTLSAKQQAKPFADAVVKPFLKAYSKKKGFDGVVEIKDVAQITVDSDSQTELQVLTDIQIFSAEAILKGSRGDIEVEIQLKDPSKAPKPPPPKPKSTNVLPRDARVIIHGLTSSAGQELNGMEGRTCGYHEDKGRYEVKLADGRIVSARMDNLIDLGATQL
jgi:hypothetical protein